MKEQLEKLKEWLQGTWKKIKKKVEYESSSDSPHLSRDQACRNMCCDGTATL